MRRQEGVDVRAHLGKPPFPEESRPPRVWAQREAERKLLGPGEAAPFLSLLADLLGFCQRAFALRLPEELNDRFVVSPDHSTEFGPLVGGVRHHEVRGELQAAGRFQLIAIGLHERLLGQPRWPWLSEELLQLRPDEG
jgi:hypothetical protein